MRKTDIGVLHHRLHAVERFQAVVDAHGVKNAETFLADVVAFAGGAAQHLLVEDAAVNAAQEHQIADRRHVDAGGQQVDGDGNHRIGFVAVLADQRQRFVDAAGNLDHGIVVHFHALGVKGGLQQAHHHVGVAVGGAEHQRLVRAKGRDAFRQRVADHLIETFGDHFLVEFRDLEIQFIRGLVQVDAFLLHVVDGHLVAHLVVDAALVQLGADVLRRFVVHQMAVQHGFAVGIDKHRRSENLGGVQRRGGGKADLHRVEVVQHAAVFGDVIQLVAEHGFGVGHFPVQQITAMAFIHHDAVVGIHRQGIVVSVHDAVHQTLHGGDMHLGVGLGLRVVQFLDAENVGETLQRLHRRFLERIGSLLTQCRAIHQKQNAAETLRFQQTVNL